MAPLSVCVCKRNDPIVSYSVVEASGHREEGMGPRDEKRIDEKGSEHFEI